MPSDRLPSPSVRKAATVAVSSDTRYCCIGLSDGGRPRLVDMARPRCQILDGVFDRNAEIAHKAGRSPQAHLFDEMLTNQIGAM